MSHKKIKILVVDDSAFMRLLITDILSGDPELEIIGTANNGKQAVEFVQKQKPDLILLDLVMDEYDGLYAVREIMNIDPVPILILSAVGNTDLEPVFEALRLGAVDYLNKPNRNSAKMRLKEEELVHKVKQVARKARPKFYVQESLNNADQFVLSHISGDSAFNLIVVGASTGGPTAIERFVKSLPSNLPVPVVIVQHMPSNFIPSFVNRLDSISPMQVMIGEKGLTLKSGTIYVSTGEANLIVVEDPSTKRWVFDYDDHIYKEYNKPSINALFDSTSKLSNARILAVLMTGMGKDGVKGLETIKKSSGYVLVQDQNTSVIFGMPKAAIAAGVVDEILPLHEIAPRILKILRS